MLIAALLAPYITKGNRYTMKEMIVKACRSLHIAGYSIAEIAKAFELDDATVGRYINNTSFKDKTYANVVEAMEQTIVDDSDINKLLAQKKPDETAKASNQETLGQALAEYFIGHLGGK